MFIILYIRLSDDFRRSKIRENKTQPIHHEQTELASKMLKQSNRFIIKENRATSFPRFLGH